MQIVVLDMWHNYNSRLLTDSAEQFDAESGKDVEE